jgi:hypothetical protein
VVLCELKCVSDGNLNDYREVRAKECLRHANECRNELGLEDH